MRISGITFIHNGVEADYCFEEAIQSMLGVCDEVVVVEAESSDNTRERLKDMGQTHKIRVISATWRPAPLNRERNEDWTKDLGEVARASARYPYIAYVQGDEVLHENDYAAIRQCAETNQPYFVYRYNFWQSPTSLIPHGTVCGHWIVRLGPKRSRVMWGSETLDPAGAQPSQIGLYHYGFLRDPKAFRKKAEIMLPNFCGAMDPRVYEVEKNGWKAFPPAWDKKDEIPFTGTHPNVIHGWLRDRGYNA